MDRWNHNIHYHPLLHALGPAGRVLDVGCGEGMLSREMAELSAYVIGIDTDENSVRTAREQTSLGNTEFICADVMAHPFERESFEVIVSVAALHHLETAPALTRFASLLKPEGRLGVVGIGRSRPARDIGWNIAGAALTRWHKWALRKAYWEHAAPVVWPPPETYAQVERTAHEILPGCRFTRRALWRFTLEWTKPRPTPPN